MRRWQVIMAAVLAGMAVASVVDAGVWGTIKSGVVDGGLTVVFAAIAAVFGKKWLGLKAPVQALIAVFRRYQAAKLLQSDGGRDISKAEWNVIFADMTAAVEAIISAIPAGWLPAAKGR
jgi:hypothetical protein